MPIRYTIAFYAHQPVVAHRDFDAESPEDAALQARKWLDDGNETVLDWTVDGEVDAKPSEITFDVIDATSDEFQGTEADLGPTPDQDLPADW